MKPRLEILPSAQLKLWPALKTVPRNYILYGGIDFDFFSSQPLNKNILLEALPFLREAKIVQPEINTLDCYVSMNHESVKLQFLAGLGTRLGRVEEPLRCDDNGIFIASLRDLLANKLNTIQSRAEMKDYVDIDAILQTGISLAEGLGCSMAIFGKTFDPGTSLRALCSYADGDLTRLPVQIRNRLIQQAIRVEMIPSIAPLSKDLNFI